MNVLNTEYFKAWSAALVLCVRHVFRHLGFTFYFFYFSIFITQQISLSLLYCYRLCVTNTYCLNFCPVFMTTDTQKHETEALRLLYNVWFTWNFSIGIVALRNTLSNKYIDRTMIAHRHFFLWTFTANIHTFSTVICLKSLMEFVFFISIINYLHTIFSFRLAECIVDLDNYAYKWLWPCYLNAERQ